MKTIELKDIAIIDWGNTSLTKSAFKVNGKYLGVSAAGCDGRMDNAEHQIGTIVLSAIGANCGRMFYPCEPFTAIKNTITITPKENTDSKFLFYYLNNNQISSRGAGQPFITKGDASKKRIPKINYTEQKKIAAILDAADAYRQKTKALITKYDELTQSLFLDMFGDQVVKLKKIQFVKLSEVVNNNKIITYGIVQAGENLKNGVPYIRTGDIKNGKILIEKLQKTSPEIAKSYERSKCAAGDIVMSIRATVGTIAIVPPELDGVNLTQGTARISPDTKIIDRYFLYYCLKSKDVQLKIEKQTKGATFREITLGRLKEIEIPLPSLISQAQFAERVQAIETQKAQAQASLEKAEELFNSLLQRAFKGELM